MRPQLYGCRLLQTINIAILAANIKTVVHKTTTWLIVELGWPRMIFRSRATIKIPTRRNGANNPFATAVQIALDCCDSINRRATKNHSILAYRRLLYLQRLQSARKLTISRPTMEQSSHRMPSSRGPRITRLTGTSCQDSPCRMATSKASTERCGMST